MSTSNVCVKINLVENILPLEGSSSDIFRTNTFHILKSYIGSPYLLSTIPVLLGICCTLFTVKIGKKIENIESL